MSPEWTTARAGSLLRGLIALALMGAASRARELHATTASPTPTRTRMPVCTPPPCATGEVFYCPGDCPGGCGTICVTPGPSPTPTPNLGAKCTFHPGPPSIDFGDVTVASLGYDGATLIGIEQDQTATETISVNLSFDPSPPFFDDATGVLRSSVTLAVPPGSIDDHLIRCVPTAPGHVHGTLTVSATNCPVVIISLACNGTESETPTPSPSPAPVACVGDCNGDRVVTIDELITAVNVALGGAAAPACPALACDSGPADSITCVIVAVNNALNGCITAVHPTASAIPSPTPTAAVIEATATATPASFPDPSVTPTNPRAATPTISPTPCSTPVCPGSVLPPNCFEGPCSCYCEATPRPSLTPFAIPPLTPDA